MAPNYTLKPETALIKAKELINVGKKLSALDILYDMMRSRRAKIWQKKLEELMLLFIDLCVELKKSAHFKRIIHQYKNITVQECPSSLEEVLRHYLKSIKVKTEEAQHQSKEAVPYVEDLDILETPESLMLNAVSVEGAQDRSDRTILMPWLKFLWDSYRIALDLLRSSTKFENMYHEVAREAYEFCLKYNRKAEFRKLSEMLRQHTIKFQNPLTPNAANNVNLSNPETQILHFTTRLQQLDYAMELEMYNEAFKTIEDIWSFVLVSKKVSKPVLMVDYYSKAANLFLRSGCQLYHAAALHKLITLYRDHKKSTTREELAAMGARVLCATLAIPLPHVRIHFDRFPVTGEQNTAKQKTLASLLGLTHIPTRASLIRDLVRNRLPMLVCPELYQLYNAMEVDFQPLNIAERAVPALQYIGNESQLSVYTESLHDCLVSKTLLQLSQVYRTLSLDSLVKFCPYMHPLRLERCIVDLIHNLELPIRLDHRNKSIVFDVFTDLGISQRQYGGQGGEQIGTPDQLSRQLVLFAEALYQVTEILKTSTVTAETSKTKDPLVQSFLYNEDTSAIQIRSALVKAYRNDARQDRMNLLARRDLIEGRKEVLERLRETRNRVYLEEEARRRAIRERDAADEEAHLAEEARLREQHKTEEKQAKLKQRIATENLKIIMKSELAASFDVSQITDDMDALIEKRMQEMNKKRREIAEKAKKRATKLDYFTRAARLEEIDLLKEAAALEVQQSRELHIQTQREIEEKARIEHQQRVKDRQRLSRMADDIKKYVADLKKASERNLEERRAEWMEQCKAARVARIEELKARQEAEAKHAEEAAEAMRQRLAEEEAAAASSKDRDRDRRTLGFAERLGGDMSKQDGQPFRRGFQMSSEGDSHSFGRFVRRKEGDEEATPQSTGPWVRGILVTPSLEPASTLTSAPSATTNTTAAAPVAEAKGQEAENDSNTASSGGVGEWRSYGPNRSQTALPSQALEDGAPKPFSSRIMRQGPRPSEPSGTSAPSPAWTRNTGPLPPNAGRGFTRNSMFGQKDQQSSGFFRNSGGVNNSSNSGPGASQPSGGFLRNSGGANDSSSSGSGVSMMRRLYGQLERDDSRTQTPGVVRTGGWVHPAALDEANKSGTQTNQPFVRGRITESQ